MSREVAVPLARGGTLAGEPHRPVPTGHEAGGGAASPSPFGYQRLPGRHHPETKPRPLFAATVERLAPDQGLTQSR